MRIVTLTPNPSLDRTLEVDGLTRGEVLRCTGARVEAGGKGVNVARALTAHGVEATAVLPVGGAEGAHLERLLADGGYDVRTVPVTESTRTNISVVEPDGTVTKLNAPGHRLDDDDVAALRKAVVAALDGATWVAGCGSLPPGAPTDFYAGLVAQVRDAGARVAVDTSGAPLRAVLDAGPDVVKPNDEELAAAVGRPLTTLGDVVDAAEELRGRGVGAVLVSLGRHGALLVDGDGARHADAPPVTPVSNVGAGDSTLAGYLRRDGRGDDALRSAVAFGTAAVQLPGTAVPGPDDVDEDAVRLHPVDRERRLDDTAG